MSKHIIVAVDGPAGSGKSTVAKILAKKLNYTYIDTGAMYRAITLVCIEAKIIPSESEQIIKKASQLKMHFEKSELIVNGRNVSNEIRMPVINENVSKIASIPDVRHILVDIQRHISQNADVVMEGRDIGTVVFPNASYKFFLEASVEVRAQRRYKEEQQKGIKESLDEIKQSIVERDKQDKSRKVSPLKKADDAILLDTSKLSIDQVVDNLYNTIKKNN